MKNRAGGQIKQKTVMLTKMERLLPLVPASIQVIHVKAENPRDKGSDT